VGGKFGAASVFALLFVFTTELFPTVVRNSALGTNSAAARVGGVLAPVIVLLAQRLHWGGLSFAVFGVSSMAAGAGLKERLNSDRRVPPYTCRAKILTVVQFGRSNTRML
jgi:MFS family permease